MSEHDWWPKVAAYVAPTVSTPVVVGATSATELRAIQQAKLLFLISQGPIQGIQHLGWGLRDVHLNNVPIQNADGTFNFNGISVAMTSGTTTQGVISGFSDVETLTTSGAQITVASPQLVSVTNSAANAVRVNVSMPMCKNIKSSTGEVTGSQVQLKFEVSTNNGSFVDVTSTVDGYDTNSSAGVVQRGMIYGRSDGSYAKGFRVALPAGSAWVIRVSRTTADTPSGPDYNLTYLQSYSVITEQQLRYPSRALLAVALDASRFSSIPTVTVAAMGVRIQVPSNYTAAYQDPDSGTWTPAVYSGGWDGTFKTVWSSNPAWVFYDMATNTRYGAGRYLSASAIDKWTLYDIASYCDEMVSDGVGGLEPRFSFNGYLTSQDEAFKMLAHIISSCRTQLYYGSGKVVPVQDIDIAPVGVFTPTNVVDGKFSYQSTARKARHTQANVTWMDPSQNYSSVLEPVMADDSSLSRYGIQTTSFVAVGSTSLGQTRRAGRYVLLTEQECTESVSFSTGMEGIVARPGDVILIQDPGRAKVRLGGRIKSATSTSIVPDAPTTLLAGQTYTLWVQLPDGSVVSQTVTSAAGTVTSISLAGALPQIPQEQAQWLLSSSSQPATRWRIVSIEETHTSTTKTFAVVAVSHVPSIYAQVDSTDALVTRPVVTYSCPPVTGLAASSIPSYRDGVTTYQIAASWDVASGAISYRADIQRDGTWHMMQISGAGGSYLDTTPGTYRIRVLAIYPGGISAFAYVSITSVVTPVPKPTGCDVTFADGLQALNWVGVVDPLGRPITYEIRKGSTWDTGQIVAQTTITSTTISGVGTYWVAATTVGIYSVPAGVIASGALDRNVIVQYDEGTSWKGSSTGPACIELDEITLGGQGYFDDIADIDSCPNYVYFGGTKGAQVIYEPPVSTRVDLGVSQTAILSSSIDVALDSCYVMFDDIPNVDAAPFWCGDYSGLAWARVELAKAGDDGVWGDWAAFLPGKHIARKFKYRVVMGSDDDSATVRLAAFQWAVDMPDRVESGTGIVIPAAGSVITFSRPFQIIPNIQITNCNAASGDYQTLTNLASSGFTIRFSNNGSGVSRTIHWIAQGY